MESTNNYIETDLGNVSPNPKGAYDNETAYEYLDLVEYQGGSYLCTVDFDKTVKGISPTAGQNSETWQLVALPGTSTEEYVAKYIEVIEKAKQVETSRAAVELCKQEVESAQADVEQMRQDTQQVAQNASDANTEAQQAAQQAEASRSAAQTSEQNAAASRNLADTYKADAETAKSAAETAAQKANESKTAAEIAAQNAAQSKEDIDNIKSDIEEAAKGENVSQIQQNMKDIGEIKEVLSTDIEDNPEYLKAIVDAEGRFLLGIRKDGMIVYGYGVPEQIQKEIDDLAQNIDIKISDLDEDLVQKLDVAVKELGYSEDNPEYLKVMIDNDGKVIESTDLEGNKKIHGNLRVEGSLKVENLSEFEEILINKGFLKKAHTDWTDATSVEIPEPRCAMVNISNVDAMPTSKFVNVKAYLEFWDMQGNYFKKKVILNAQGNSSMGFVKKNFAVDLCNDDWIGDDTFSLRIGDWVPQDSYHCKAYYTDFFRGVAVTSYKLNNEILKSRGIMDDRPWKKALINMNVIATTTKGIGDISDLSLQIDNGARCFPDGFPVIVYLKGEFYGIFSWQLKKHRDNMHQTKDVAEHIHLDGTISPQTLLGGTIDWTQFEVRNPKGLYCMDGTKYDGDTNLNELIDETSVFYALDSDTDKILKAKKMTAKVKSYIKSFSKAMVEIGAVLDTYTASKTDENKQKIKELFEKYFDVENQIDYLILSDVVKNADGFSKNWQWTTYDGVKWYVNLYDVDMSFGGHFQGNQITEPLKTHISTTRLLPPYYIETFYKEDLESRYKELRDIGIIDTAHIVGILNSWTQRIGQENYKKEYAKWTDAPCNGDSVIDADYWELQEDEFGQPITGTSDYDASKQYAVGDICYYGVSSAIYQYKCIQSCMGIKPLKVIRYRDNIYRVAKWIAEEINNMDKVYNYNK